MTQKRFWMIVMCALSCAVTRLFALRQNAHGEGSDDRRESLNALFPKSRYTDAEMYEMMDAVRKHTGHQTFYDLLGVGSRATVQDVGSAFRRSAAAWHPDKSKHAAAAEMYPVVSAVAQILRDVAENGSRAHYDWLLNDAPAWHRSTVYVRRLVTAKLHLREVLLLVLIFTHVVQFVAMWSKYGVDRLVLWDARRTLAQMGDKEMKKMLRKISLRDLPASHFETDDCMHAYALTQRPIHVPSIRELLVVDVAMRVICGVWRLFSRRARVAEAAAATEAKTK